MTIHFHLRFTSHFGQLESSPEMYGLESQSHPILRWASQMTRHYDSHGDIHNSSSVSTFPNPWTTEGQMERVQRGGSELERRANRSVGQ